MTTTWIAVADEGRARIFSARPQVALRELEDLLAIDSRRDEHAQAQDAYGHLGGSISGGSISGGGGGTLHSRHVGGPGHSAEPRTNSADHRAQQFARQLAQRLEAGLHAESYQRLILVAAPRFLGHLRLSLPTAVRKRLAFDVAKDFSKLSLAEIEQRLQALQVPSPARHAPAPFKPSPRPQAAPPRTPGRS